MTFEKLGPYRVERCLGRGGMGTVYLGVHEESEQQAALKVLSPALADDDSFRERFGIEIETLKKLKHPNIVELFGYGEQDGHVFYAMEMVHGRNFHDELHSGRRFNWRDAARVGVQICSALKHAHDRGVIHRDLKPANLLLADDQQIKLSDFGIAKLFGSTHHTVDGGILGTADYMSPEQAEGRPVTARSDLYSLGSVLFALVARRPPFAAKSVAEVIHGLRFEPAPSLREYAPEVPREFADLVASLLQKDPGDRVATALAVSHRLQAMDLALPRDTRVDRLPSEATLAHPENYDTDPDGTQVSEPARRSPSDAPTRDSSDLLHRDSTIVAPEDEPLPDEEFQIAPLVPAEPRPAGTHFREVTEHERRASTAADGEPWDPAGIAKILLMLIAIAGIVGAVWWAMQPASADRLYDKISRAAEADDPDDLLAVDDEIAEFVDRFPDDPRFGEVQAYGEAIELERLHRRFERQARRARGTGEMEPVERAYLDALALSGREPERAARRLEALIDLYEPATPASESVRQCLELAERQLEQLRRRIGEQSASGRRVLEERLHRAERLRESDLPAARRIWRGMVELYGDQAWAADAVQRARTALEETGG